MEEAIVTAVTHDTSEAKITVTSVPDKPGVAARLFRELASKGVNVDMIVQNVSSSGHTDISFTIPTDEIEMASGVLEPVVKEIGAASFETDEGIARVSVVGAGMKSHPGVAATMFETLAEQNVNIEMISTSSIRLSCVIRVEEVERAVQSIHAAYELDEQ